MTTVLDSVPVRYGESLIESLKASIAQLQLGQQLSGSKAWGEIYCMQYQTGRCCTCRKWRHWRTYLRPQNYVAVLSKTHAGTCCIIAACLKWVKWVGLGNIESYKPLEWKVSGLAYCHPVPASWYCATLKIWSCFCGFLKCRMQKKCDHIVWHLFKWGNKVSDSVLLHSASVQLQFICGAHWLTLKNTPCLCSSELQISSTCMPTVWLLCFPVSVLS